MYIVAYIADKFSAKSRNFFAYIPEGYRFLTRFHSSFSSVTNPPIFAFVPFDIGANIVPLLVVLTKIANYDIRFTTNSLIWLGNINGLCKSQKSNKKTPKLRCLFIPMLLQFSFLFGLVIEHDNFFADFPFRGFKFGNIHARNNTFYWNLNILLFLIFNFPRANGLTKDVE